MKQYVLLVCLWSCLSANMFVQAQETADLSDNNQYMHDVLVDFDNNLEAIDSDTPLRKTKWLTVDYLNVKQNLTVRGSTVTANSSTFSGSYGQLSVSETIINLETINTWVPVPFTASGPSSNMTVSTTPPATITIQNNGAYQIGLNFCFLVEDAPEGFIFDSRYTFGITVNGVTTPTTATVFVSTAGEYVLNYTTIMELTTNDQIQFTMKSTFGSGPINANIVTLESGNAYVMQISN